MLVMFDLDDTLLDTRAALTVARTALLQKVGLAGSAGQLDAWRRLTWFFKSEDLSVILPILAHDTGAQLGEQDWKALLSEYWQIETAAVAWNAGAVEVLDTLVREGFSIGIVCNGTVERQQAKLKHVGLWERLQAGAAIRIADGVAVPAKPRPDALQDLRTALGADTETTCYIGDLPLDVVAANLANMTSIRLESASLAAGMPPENGQHPLEIPDHRVASLNELPVLLTRLRTAGQA